MKCTHNLKRRCAIEILYLIAIFITIVVPSRCEADFTFSLGLGSASVVGDQVVIPVNAVFMSQNLSPGNPDYINAVFVDFSASDGSVTSPLAPSSDQYSRISVDNVLSNWQFLGIDPNSGVAGSASTASIADLKDSPSPVRLFDLKFDGSGLASGTYTLSIFKLGSTDASGQISGVGVPSFSAYDPLSTGTTGTIDFNNPGSVQFTLSLTAVPEPTSLIGAFVLAACAGFKLQRRSSREKRK